MATENINAKEYETFCNFLKDACGIVLGQNKLYLVNSRLKRLLEEEKISSVSQLIDTVSKGANARLRGKIVDAMTTNETYWFRDQNPYLIMQESLLPELLQRSSKPLRIWSAACSSGQEPYSISMILEEFFQSRPSLRRDVEIIATDISPTMLSRAREGTYDEITVARGMDELRRAKFFSKQGSVWRVNDKIRARVKFVEFNLMKNFSSLGHFDVVFCRNVLIYFSSELKSDILNRISSALLPDSYLFLGGSESMASYCRRFDTVRFKSGLVFKLKSD